MKSAGPTIPGAGDSSKNGTPSKLLVVLLFGGLWGIYGCFHHSRDWNTASRLLLTYAIVQERTIETTSFFELENGQLSRRPHTRDLSSPGNGRYFCDKAPGHSFLAVIPYWLALKLNLVEPHPTGSPAQAYWPMDYWVTWWTNGFWAAATAALIFWILCELGVAPGWAIAAALAYGLATTAMSYATLFYGHVTTGFFSLLSFRLMFLSRSYWSAVAAGLASGFAVMIEYPQVVLPAAIALVYGVTCLVGNWPKNRCTRWLLFILGGIPIAVGLGYYHFLVTGSPFRPPYVNEVLPAFAAYHRKGSGIPIGPVDWQVVVELLIGQPRGILWYAPVTLGALPGLWRLCRDEKWPMAAVIILTFAGLLVINAGFPAWDGGMATGPRFLLPSFPLLMVAVGYWLGTRSAVVPVVDQLTKTVWCLVAVVSGFWLLLLTTIGGRIPFHEDQTAAMIWNGAWSILKSNQQEPFFRRLDCSHFASGSKERTARILYPGSPHRLVYSWNCLPCQQPITGCTRLTEQRTRTASEPTL